MQQFGRDPVNETQWRALDAIGAPWQSPSPHDWLLAIDDTDNLTSRGTGFLARQLALRLGEHGLADVKAITRHQLLVDPRIPYTSHNSSACLVLAAIKDRRAVFDYTCDYLLKESAEGSDAGTVLVRRDALPQEMRDFGAAAKVSVLEQNDARALAARHGIDMAGLTGTGGGVIGALAATGLNASGRDGRFLWIKRLRSMSCERHSAATLQQLTGIAVQTIDGNAIPHDDIVDLGEWPRAVFVNEHPTLLVEKTDEPIFSGWRSASKNHIRQHF
ncbi:hypothetical protein [Oxalicibacterium solurbis]|uniref:tRNA(Ile2) 2-agmatinylcytidine synthetase n=1 Tax=Oxalicibacterium solurbis TaxID=69280 RepID=A0A8J3ATK9_9BURK|nr:hypothetical protein [Oxalicibacterium solurbis]GGI53454.1 hypothetical protein GCM10011430_06280 [Oxalicibacterium solurbis]